MFCICRQMDNLEFHPSSVFSDKKLNWEKHIPSDWIIYDEMLTTTTAATQDSVRGNEEEKKVEMIECTLVSSASVALLGGHALHRPELWNLRGESKGCLRATEIIYITFCRGDLETSLLLISRSNTY